MDRKRAKPGLESPRCEQEGCNGPARKGTARCRWHCHDSVKIEVAKEKASKAASQAAKLARMPLTTDTLQTAQIALQESDYFKLLQDVILGVPFIVAYDKDGVAVFGEAPLAVKLKAGEILSNRVMGTPRRAADDAREPKEAPERDLEAIAYRVVKMLAQLQSMAPRVGKGQTSAVGPSPAGEIVVEAADVEVVTEETPKEKNSR